MYKAAFWVLVFITIVTMILQSSGYDFLDTVIFLVVVDFIALWMYLEKRRYVSGVDDELARKVGNIENACLKISEGIGSISSVLNLEEKVNKQRDDINLMLEKINEKTSNLEEKLNGFAQSLTSSVAAGREDSNEPKETYSNIS